MLNRFQFSRLRAFRRGKKRSAEAGAARNEARQDSEARVGHGTEAAPGRDGEWSGEDRMTTLLRQHAAGDSAAEPAGTPAAADPGQGRLNGGGAAQEAPVASSTATPAAARTRTVPAAAPEPVVARPAESEQRVRLVDGIRSATTARVVCIASGKGGTGKSVLASNLALLRARRGERVLLIDFDAGLANAHLLLGLAPPHDVGHVMEGKVSAREALVEGPHGLKLLSGGVGRQSLIDPTRRELDRLFKALRPLEDEFDLIVIDHGAGLSYSTVAHLAATSTLVLVTNHEVTALSDGYALYKRAKLVNPEVRVGLVVNRAPDERLAMDAWDRFRGASHKFLGHAPELIGWVPADPVISQAVQMRRPAVLSFPDSAAARAITKVAAWGPIDHARTSTPFYAKARRALR
ncbi:MAG: AAA family ATPase [Planctomycetota bacterium]|jgi:flagellar biosynthesis protein FlhG